MYQQDIVPREDDGNPDKKTPAISTERSDDHETRRARRSSDIGIIGISGRFAGSANLEAFWSHLQAGESCIAEIQRAGWEMSTHSDPDPKHPRTSLGKWGGMLEHIDQFDPLFFGISPLECKSFYSVGENRIIKWAVKWVRVDRK